MKETTGPIIKAITTNILKEEFNFKEEELATFQKIFDQRVTMLLNEISRGGPTYEQRRKDQGARTAVKTL
jgi:hypothetical protein